ncbi:MAG: bifunctional diaminohydroxyphosphoribosylaminopyrimidine deaminase/5-amino-6-(5-phosphoribosylamino)uracil reductase RibD [Bacteroidia bacterium]|nr:bifunctional diaminohydroxyphosphoribosylaminopyrimidine deaminase/5-amino-6-(5-phosphoribosylamino)uracil reductase RibD [Bacteroidia bacterium]
MKPETNNMFMKEALSLATTNYRNVAPNPMVGCVIVYQNNIVASGYHQKYGGPHAEVNAINNLPKDILPQDCTVYVTLEPCSHHGKTPPCADLLITKGFKRVVVAAKDPNPLVAGEGIKKMQAAGIAVTVGVLEKEAVELNRIFFTWFQKQRPYYLLKWAQTADGFISRLPVPENRADNKISGAQEQEETHYLRSQYLGIMVGKNTVLSDNPHLTTRLVIGQNPSRIFLDKDLKVPRHFNIYNHEAPTIVFNGLKSETEANILFIQIDFNGSVLEQINHHLYNLKIQSVMVEGGANLLQQFINQELWDEYRVVVNPKMYFNSGVKAPDFGLDVAPFNGGEDVVYNFKKPVCP